jgi:hypothetical protein
VLARQKRDHVKLGVLLDRLEAAPPGEEAPLLRQLYRLVFPHAFAEEAVLWPVLRHVLPDGEALTLRVEKEHQEINELVTRLEALDPGTREHREALNQMIGLLRIDARDEEDALLPRLQMTMAPAQLRRLGAAWEAVRMIAPTRAHPIVSRRPPGNVLSALPLSVLDRCRDGVDALVHRGAGPAEPALRRLGQALAGAAHAVERLPGMRRGEDPATRAAAKPRSVAPVFGAIVLGAGAAWMLRKAVRR